MKKLILCALILFQAYNTFSQSSAVKTKHAVLKVLEKQRQAWNKGDIAEYMQGYWKSDSLLFVGKNGPKYGWQNTLENYQKSYPDKAAMGYLMFDIKEIRLLNSQSAFVLGAWSLKRQHDGPHGFFTLLVKKINGEWKVVADHSS